MTRMITTIYPTNGHLNILNEFRFLMNDLQRNIARQVTTVTNILFKNQTRNREQIVALNH